MNLLRFKNLCSNKDIRAGLHAETLPLMSVSQTRGVLPRSELTGEALGRAESLEHYKLCGPGDIVLNRMSAYNGAVGVAKEPGLVSPDYLVLRPRVAACPEYLGYLIKSHWFVGEMTSRLRGIGSADNAGVRTPRIGLGELNSIEVRELSFDEQRSIVRYLDRETAEIDEFVAESEKLITLLNERRAAVITQAVTKGLDPTAPMKDTGIEGADQVPSHWRVVRISWLFKETASGTTPDSGEMLPGNEAKIPWVTSGELREANLTSTSKGVSAETLTRYSALTVHPPGSLLIAMYGATIGRMCILGVAAASNQAVCALRQPLEADVNFILFALLAAKERLLLESAGGGQPNINQDKVRAFRIPAPGLAEQTAIAKSIGRRTAKIDEAIATAREAIALAKERRQALISAAVTGKIDVRSAP